MIRKKAMPLTRLIVLLLAAAALVLLVTPLSIGGRGRVFRAWWDFAHVPAFIAITSGLLLVSFRFKCSRVQCLAIWLVALGSVPGIEQVQGYSAGREQSTNDMLYGATGCLIGGCLVAGLGKTGWWARAAVLLAALLAVVSLAYPVRLSAEDLRIKGMFPVLSSFDSPLEVTRWSIHNCDVRLNDGWDITVRDQDRFACLVLGDMIHDWSKMKALGMDMYLRGDEPMEMKIVLDDRPFFPSYDERFQTTLTLEPGWNRLLLDRKRIGITSGGRRMCLETIHALGVYFNGRYAGRQICWTKLYLVHE